MEDPMIKNFASMFVALFIITTFIIPTGVIAAGLSAESIFTRVNAHRAALGLKTLIKDDRVCQVATSRAPEIANEIASNTMHVGIKKRNLPYWNTENIISMGTEVGAINWWLGDTIHRKAIEGPYKYTCVACSGYSCVEEFTNFQPK
jgi:uncharacterized protein YkwD